NGVIQAGNGLRVIVQTSGTVRLQGANTYAGGTTLTTGTLSLEKAGALGTAGNFSFNGGVLQSTVAGTNTLVNPVILGGDPARCEGSGALEFSGLLTNSANNRLLINNLTGGATLTLSAANAVSLSNDSTGRTLTLAGAGTTIVSGIVQN